MEKFKKIGMRLLYPHPVIVLLLAVVSFVGLLYVFICSQENTPIAYVLYLMSAYALVIVVVLIPPLVKKCRSNVYKNAYAVRYLDDRELRTRISLYTGTVINLAYAAFKLFVGIFYKSFWFGTVAVYYMVLCVIRYLLIYNDNQTRYMDDRHDSLWRQWKSYCTCGFLLFILNIAMTGMVAQIIWQNKSYNYPGYVIYVSAGYTFYRFIMAVVRNIKMKKSDNPVFSAAKTVDLIIALMSVFVLQTAMLTSFGGSTSEETKRFMNSITGGTVCFLVVCMAVFMIIYSVVTLLKMKKNKLESVGGFHDGK